MAAEYGTYRVFISSSMAELVEERKVIERVIRQSGYQPFLYERDANARPWNHEETFVQELKASHLYVGIFWNKYGPYTVQEFDLAKERGIPRLVFEKASGPGERDKELQKFLDQSNKVTGADAVTIARFTSASDLEEKFQKSFQSFLAEMAIRGWEVKDVSIDDSNTYIRKDVLPCLCDRDRQEVNFLETISVLKLPSTKRPFLWVLPGPANEEHWLFVKRMKEHSLKKHYPSDGKRQEIKVVNIPQSLALLTTPERLRRAILDNYPLDITGNDKSLLSEVKKEKVKLLLIDIKLKEKECDGNFVEHLRVITSYLGNLSDLPPGLMLGIIVCVINEETAQNSSYFWGKMWKMLSGWSKNPISLNETFAEFNRLYQDGHSINFKNFERLKPSTTEDVGEWCRRDEVTKHVGVLMEDKIHNHIFFARPQLPMRELYDKLIDLLEGRLING